jgi:hypothetical protein
MYETALELAQQVIGDAGSSPAARELAKQARDNARLNLKALDN